MEAPAKSNNFDILFLSEVSLPLHSPRMKQQKSLKAVSGGLLGALTIASGTSAYGAIVNSTVPANSTIAAGDPTANINWDVNNDGIVDFIFGNRFPAAGGSGVEWQINMNPAAGNAVLGYGAGATFGYGSAFTLGTSIGPTAPAGTAFVTVAQVIMGSVFNGTPYGGFASPSAPGNGSVTAGNFSYAAFRFAVGGQNFFGWIRMSANAGTLNFTSAAWENVAGGTIPAGSVAVPEPTTMAGLAMGAALLGGVALRQRRRRLAA